MRIVADVVHELTKNALMAIPTVRTLRMNSPRAGEMFEDQAQLPRLAFQSLDLLTDSIGGIEGKSILEIGPGDYLSSGLSLLAAGATSYTAIDRFPGHYGSPKAKRWYAAIQSTWSSFYPELQWPPWLQSEYFPEKYTDRVKFYGLPVEQARNLGVFDVVCSFQVAEHVSNIRAFARVNRELTATDGVAVHCIDFGPHGVWCRYDDPLTFLRFSDALWSAMGSARGTPNRRRVHEIVKVFEAEHFNVELSNIELLPDNSVDISRLAGKFQGMPKNSLMIRSALFVCSPTVNHLKDGLVVAQR